jgi:hypothetical protein
MDRAQAGQEITSLREVYDLWVDAGEAAYSEFVLTEEYAAIYGRLVNALMALKHHSQNLVDEAVGAANLPTRRDILTLQCRQQEARRQIAALRTELGEAIGDGLNMSLRRFEETLGEALGGVDVKALSAEVQALRGEAVRVADLEREIALLSADNKRLSAAVGALSANGQETTVLGKRDDAAPAAKRRTPAQRPATRSRSKIT